jgi:hypothetical protein
MKLMGSLKRIDLSNNSLPDVRFPPFIPTKT